MGAKFISLFLVILPFVTSAGLVEPALDAMTCLQSECREVCEASGVGHIKGEAGPIKVNQKARFYVRTVIESVGGQRTSHTIFDVKGRYLGQRVQAMLEEYALFNEDLAVAEIFEQRHVALSFVDRNQYRYYDFSVTDQVQVKEIRERERGKIKKLYPRFFREFYPKNKGRGHLSFSEYGKSWWQKLFDTQYVSDLKVREPVVVSNTRELLPPLFALVTLPRYFDQSGSDRTSYFLNKRGTYPIVYEAQRTGDIIKLHAKNLEDKEQQLEANVLADLKNGKILETDIKITVDGFIAQATVERLDCRIE